MRRFETMDDGRFKNMFIKIKGPALPRIRTTRPTLPKVEASVVAQALGAEAVSAERLRLPNI